MDICKRLVLCFIALQSLCTTTFSSSSNGSKDKLDVRKAEALVVVNLENQLRALEHSCVEYSTSRWWKYSWCHKRQIRQYHRESSGKITLDWSAGAFWGKQGNLGRRRSGRRTDVLQVPDYLSYQFKNGQRCDETGVGRRSEVRVECCGSNSKRRKDVPPPHLMKPSELAKIQSVVEIETCAYLVTVCSPVMCQLPDLWKHTITQQGIVQKQDNVKVGRDVDKIEKVESVVEPTKQEDDEEEKWTIRRDSNEDVIEDDEESDEEGTEQMGTILELTQSDKEEVLEKIKESFYHGYANYMTFAFPLDELKPLTCKGEDFELTAGSMLTLIDSLDMLVIIGNYSEFARSVRLVSRRANFDLDRTVSVFETTIRIIGGLLSAHIFASDEELAIMPEYKGALLPIVVDLADRLMPAFNTTTGIPYGTVHLQRGVPDGETTEACTAAAGTLSLEFGVLSVLTGDPKYGVASRAALKSIFDHRSQLGLVGRHIDVESGKWTEPIAGIGSNIDSLYEYYLKHYILFGDEEALDMFNILYEAAVAHLRIENTWYVDVNMHRGHIQRRQFNNLQAFWPGMQSLVGDFVAASRTINAFLLVWNDFGFTPEDFSIDRFVPLSGGTRRGYPLRPELAESVYYMSVATQDPSWLVAGRDMISSVELTCRVECGFASVKDIKTEKLHDTMPSFFLSEFLKYLFILFDEENFVREDRGAGYVFTTEAHPLPIKLHYQKEAMRMKFAFPSSGEKHSAERKKKGKSLWGISSLKPEMAEERQCAALNLNSWEKEAANVEVYYGVDVELRKPRRSGFTTSPSLKSPAGTKSLPPLLDAAARLTKDLLGELKSRGASQIGEAVPIQGDGDNNYMVRTFENGFHVEETSTGTVIEVTSLGNDVICCKLILGDTKEQRYLFLDRKKSEFGVTCSLEYRIQDKENAVCHAEDDANGIFHRVFTSSRRLHVKRRHVTTAPFQCSVSDFGPAPFEPKEMHAKLVKATIPTGCTDDAYPQNLVQGNIVMVSRGDCMFEQKARLAEKQGALGVLVLQNKKEEPLFYMVGMNSDPSSMFPSSSLTKIPAFMVSVESGNALKYAFDQVFDHQDLVVKVKVRQVRKNHEIYPWAAVSNGKVLVSVDQSWGVKLVTSGDDDTWSLSILNPKTDPDLSLLK